jgi:hypothetical protein
VQVSDMCGPMPDGNGEEWWRCRSWDCDLPNECPLKNLDEKVPDSEVVRTAEGLL